MSKPMLMTLPFVLLLLDYWPLGRSAEWGVQMTDSGNSGSVDFSLMLISCLAGGESAFLCADRRFVRDHLRLGAQQRQPSLGGKGAVGSAAGQCAGLLRAVSGEDDLARGPGVPYPMPSHWAWWQTGGAVLVLVADYAVGGAAGALGPVFDRRLAYFSGRARSHHPPLSMSGFQSIADRYTYLPLIGIFIAVVWAAADWGGRRRGAGGVAQPSGQDTPSGTPAPRAALGAAGAVHCGHLPVELELVRPLNCELISCCSKGS